MHIAIIVRRLNVNGGTQRAAVNIAKAFKAQGHEVKLYTFFYDREMCYPEILSDFKVIEPDAKYAASLKATSAQGGLRAFFANYINENRASRNLAQKISKDTDILNPHDQLAHRVAHYFKKDCKNIPSVWVLNDVSTKKSGLRRVSEFDKTFRISLLKRLLYWLIDLYEYRSFIESQEIIAVLDTRDKKWADEEFPRSTTVVVRNGLDMNEFVFTPRQGIMGKKINLLAVAILLPHRRFEDAIEALPLLRERGYEPHLTIVGEPTDVKYSQKLQSLVAGLGLEQSVKFAGRVEREELLSLYKDSDIFVFPSHLQSWGLAVFEAMATGLPVIVSNTAGASEVLEDKKTAMIVPPYSPGRIAEVSEKLASDPVLYRSISADGRKFVEGNISWERYAQSLMDLFALAGKKA